MELMAAVVALEHLTVRCKARLVTDCTALQRAVEEDFFQRGVKMAWINTDKLPVRNGDSWRRLQCCLGQHEVKLVCIASRSPDLFVRYAHREARRSALRDGLPVDPAFVRRLDMMRRCRAVDTQFVPSL